MIIVAAVAAAADAPLYETEFIFAPEPYHNHSSSIVKTPKGDLLACWFHGRGERNDDTLVISGARKSKGAKEWSPPFLMTDRQDLPDQAKPRPPENQAAIWNAYEELVNYAATHMKVVTSADLVEMAKKEEEAKEK